MVPFEEAEKILDGVRALLFGSGEPEEIQETETTGGE
jgi:hypothetical protein